MCGEDIPSVAGALDRVPRGEQVPIVVTIIDLRGHREGCQLGLGRGRRRDAWRCRHGRRRRRDNGHKAGKGGEEGSRGLHDEVGDRASSCRGPRSCDCSWTSGSCHTRTGVQIQIYLYSCTWTRVSPAYNTFVCVCVCTRALQLPSQCQSAGAADCTPAAMVISLATPPRVKTLRRFTC